MEVGKWKGGRRDEGGGILGGRSECVMEVEKTEGGWRDAGGGRWDIVRELRD
jgi:hypothetical protein